MFTIKSLERTHHTSRKKGFFRHNENLNKQPILNQIALNNDSFQKHPRDLSPSKRSSRQKSLSKDSRKSQKDLIFSKKDRQSTQKLRESKTPKKKMDLIKQDTVFHDRKQYTIKVEQHNANSRSTPKHRARAVYKIFRKPSKQVEKKQERFHRQQKQQQIHNNPKNQATNHRFNRFQQKTFEQEEEELDELKMENHYLKRIYQLSVEEMKHLQINLLKEKQRNSQSKKKMEIEYRKLRDRVMSEKKVNVGHIYSYENKELLRMETDKIIIQTDNECSSILLSGSRRGYPSKLSIQSRERS